MDISQNLNNLMNEAKKMQQRMQDAQTELGNEKVEGKSGGGMVTVEMTCRHDVVKVTISPTLMEEEPEMLADLVAAAFNDAVRKVEKVSQEKIAKLTAGLNIPTDLMKKDED